MAGSGGEANLEIIRSHSHKHYSALTVNGPGHLYGPPLREARKTLRVTPRAHADKLVSFFHSLSFFPSRIVRSVYWAASVPGSGARRREGAGRGAHGAARIGLQSPWPSEAGPGTGRRLGLGAWSPRGGGRPPPWAESSTPTLCGCSGLLGTVPTSPAGR